MALKWVSPAWATHRLWPLLLGVVALVAVGSIPWVGNVINVLAVLLGTGALARGLFARARGQAAGG